MASELLNQSLNKLVACLLSVQTIANINFHQLKVVWHLQLWRWWKHVSPKRPDITTSQHGVTPQIADGHLDHRLNLISQFSDNLFTHKNNEIILLLKIQNAMFLKGSELMGHRSLELCHTSHHALGLVHPKTRIHDTIILLCPVWSGNSRTFCTSTVCFKTWKLSHSKPVTEYKTVKITYVITKCIKRGKLPAELIPMSNKNVEREKHGGKIMTFHNVF